MGTRLDAKQTSYSRAVFAAALALGCESFSNDDAGAAADELRRQPATPSARELIADIVLVGDTMFDGQLALDLGSADPTFYGTVRPVRDLVEAADLALFNLETTAGAPGDWAPTPVSEASIAVEPAAAPQQLQYILVRL